MHKVEPTAYHLDALRELINIGVARAAGVLNEMTVAPVQLRVPSIVLLTPAELPAELRKLLSGTVSAVRLGFHGNFIGSAVLAFPPDSASMLVAVLTGESNPEWDVDAVSAGTLSEVGNILLNGILGSISNVLSDHLEYSLPIFSHSGVDHLLPVDSIPIDAIVVLAQARFSVDQHHITGDVILLFEVGSFDSLLLAIDRSVGVAP